VRAREGKAAVLARSSASVIGAAPSGDPRPSNPGAHQKRFFRPMTNLHFLESTAAAAASGGTTSFIVQTLPLVLIFVIFWVLMIRPQQRRMKEHQATIAAVKKGDEVVTGGGIRGKVIKVSDDEAEVEIASGVRVKVIKSTLTAVLNSSAKPAND
jgi:preprotein translocase subunit YajC